MPSEEEMKIAAVNDSTNAVTTGSDAKVTAITITGTADSGTQATEPTAVEATTPVEPIPATEPEPEAGNEPLKATALNDVVSAVFSAIWRVLEASREYDAWTSHVYDGFAIVQKGAGYWRVDYTIVDGQVVLQPREAWTLVEAEWVEAERLENTTVSFGGEVKALGAGIVGGYLVKFSDADTPDLEDDFFDAETDFGPHEKCLVYYQHGLDATLGVKRLGGKFAKGLASLKVDKVGVWIQAQLDLADEYEAAVYQLTEMGKMGWSSGTATHLVRRELKSGSNGRKSYHITTWPLGLDASLTPTPAAGPEQTKVVPLKSYAQEQAARLPGLKALLQEVKTMAVSTSTATATAVQPTPAPGKETVITQSNKSEDFNMPPEELEKLITNAVKTGVAAVGEKVTALEAKLAKEPAVNDSGYNVPGEDEEKKFTDILYNVRYGGKSDDEVKHLVMDEIAGGNYKAFVMAQNIAFAKYIRFGTGEMDAKEVKLLKRQVFAPAYVIKALQDGMDMRELKDAMVEAQGSLGGYAVPPNMQENIARRLPGLTAVRGGGARVITLVRGNSIEVPVYSGGNDRYVGNLRGQWGTETQAPAEQNATLGMETVIADIYTYKIPMSTSLVEDASNLTTLVEDDVVMTVAIDEDEVFLIGDGVGKPLGWLPGAANSLSLTEVNSGGASALTTAGIKALKRGVASQYRGRGSFVANSDTYGDIEALTVSGTGSDFAFGDLSEEGTLLRRPALESEAMPDVAANAFAILFADMSGYYIVDRAGLTVMRMQDSYTGINKVELHVRKRVGGRPVETWKAAVQKVAA
jgi:HK97 family phage major capsid protein